MLICCKKSSLEDCENSKETNLHASVNATEKNFSKSGFSLIEILIVILTIGILSATAVVNYTSVIHDTRIKSVSDKIETFLYTNKNKAKLRKIEIKLVFNEKAHSFQEPTSTNNFLNIPELYTPSVPKLIEINKLGKFKIMGQEKDEVDLAIQLPGNRLATITIKL